MAPKDVDNHSKSKEVYLSRSSPSSSQKFSQFDRPGFVVILFKSRAEIESSWRHDGFASTFGTLRIPSEVLELTPIQRVVPKGAVISATPPSVEAYAALGLELRSPAGEEAITVPTHAFVALREFVQPPPVSVWQIGIIMSRLSSPDFRSL
ncbi:uncharacterized protein N7515_003099 [Penicillium bovifimosum]|uniref:Uncharacterized protein n=1 Tax=Penicillium bovifimosum TaxID=126998 RepID=A0A9W9H4H0_9EURO|nr:uncharacterized protein N7515_003099 [Penicillium bovifimosum]KAJ5138251.1 hypothetical protein N7515_003099 [Penicillium bovifimosum]